ncbi:MAG: hypothetical protein Q8L34_02240 [Candidatus Woesearchaeota archaeon]|nr:hypothetical protein [Candidatus Woesearchaeota archaeon]
MTQNKLEKILFLDESRWFRSRLEGIEVESGRQFEVVYEQGDLYTNTPGKTKMIQDLTESGKVDYVVIGNNLGAGVEKAAAVAEAMRADRACIVWNDYYAGDEVRYAALGFKHFMSRKDLADHFKIYVGGQHNDTKTN